MTEITRHTALDESFGPVDKMNDVNVNDVVEMDFDDLTSSSTEPIAAPHTVEYATQASGISKQARERPVHDEADGETPVKILRRGRSDADGHEGEGCFQNPKQPRESKKSRTAVSVANKYPTRRSAQSVDVGNQEFCNQLPDTLLLVKADSIHNMRHQQYYNIVPQVTSPNVPIRLIDAIPDVNNKQALSNSETSECKSEVDEILQSGESVSNSSNGSESNCDLDDKQDSATNFTSCNSSTHSFEHQMTATGKINTNGDGYQIVTADNLKTVAYLDHDASMPDEEYSIRNIDNIEDIEGSKNCNKEAQAMSNNLAQLGDQGHILKTMGNSMVTIPTEQQTDNKGCYDTGENQNDGVITIDAQEFKDTESGSMGPPCQPDATRISTATTVVPSSMAVVATPQTTISDIWKLQVTPEAKPLISQATKDLVTKWATANVTSYTGTPHPILTGKYMVHTSNSSDKQTEDVTAKSHPRQAATHVYLQYTPDDAPSQSSSFQSETAVGLQQLSNMSLNSSGSEERTTSPDDEEPTASSSSMNGAIYSASSLGLFSTSTPIMPSANQLNAALFRVRNDSICETEYDVGRHAHNAKERARRARIKIACERLRDFVPGITLKTDKATVFEFAVEYLAFLKRLVGPQYDKDFLKQCSPY